MMLRNSLSSKSFLLLYIVASFLTMYFIFSPTISIPTYHHDTYKYVKGVENPACENMVGYEFSFVVARPFTAFLDCANFKFANTIDKMAIMRIVINLLIGCAVALLVLWFNSEKFALLPAFLISSVIFCLPGMNVAMIMGGTFLILPVLVALLAYLFYDKGCKIVSNHKFFASVFITLALTGLVISFLTYPSMTGFFLIPTFVLTLFTPLAAWSNTRKIIICDIIFFCISGIIYYAIAHYIKADLHVHLEDLPAPYRMVLNFNLLERWASLLHLYPALWNLNYVIAFWQSALVWSLTISGMLIALFRFYSKNLSKNILLQAIAASIILLTLASGLYMLQPINFIAERILFVFQAMCIVILAWCFQEISLLFRSKSESIFIFFLMAMFSFAVVRMNSQATQFSLVNDRELSYIITQLAAHINNEKISHIHVIAAQHAAQMGNSTYFPDDVANIINTALQKLPHTENIAIKNCADSSVDEKSRQSFETKCIADTPKNVIAVTHSRFGLPVYTSPNMLVIDMDYEGPMESNMNLNPDVD